MSAGHTCIIVTPSVITDSAPDTIHTYLYSPCSVVGQYSTSQSNLSMSASSPTSCKQNSSKKYIRHAMKQLLSLCLISNHNLPFSYLFNFLSLTSTSYSSIITVVTVVDTNDTVITVYQSQFTSTTTKVIQIDATSSSTKEGIRVSSGTCKKENCYRS